MSTLVVPSHWGKAFLAAESRAVVPPLLLPLGILPMPAPADFTFSHSMTVKFGGCSPPLMWEMQHRAWGFRWHAAFLGILRFDEKPGWLGTGV